MTGGKEDMTAGAPGNRSLAKRGSATGVYRSGRMGFGVICIAILLSALTPPRARASFVVENDDVYGASSVVLDTSTGLYWVKPIETLGLTYSAVQTDIASGLTGNFTYASYSQVHTLFSDAGITDFTNSVSAGSYAGASALVSAFGQTGGGIFSNGSYQGPYAQTVGVYAGNFDAYTIAYQLNAAGEFGCTGMDCAETSIGTFSGAASGAYGSWLVASSLDSGNVPSPVPLPASAWLMLSAIGGLGLLCRARRRVYSTVTLFARLRG
jgi:hypothetical protein